MDTHKGLTPIQVKRLRKAAEIVEAAKQGINYQHTILCQTSLPYRNPGDAVREWERTQGKAKLSLDAGKAFDADSDAWVKLGLPYGAKPRLILAHLNTEALRHGSPQVEVEHSLRAFIIRLTEKNGLNGREIRLFKDQLARLAAATIRLGASADGNRTVQINTSFIDTFELFLTKDVNNRVMWPTQIELSPRYFDSLTRHAVPLDERAMAALSNSPMALDVYAWLAQRLHRVDPKKPQFIPWIAVADQFGHGFARIRKFRETFLDVLRLVHMHYRAARVKADGQGITLRNSPPPVMGRLGIAKN